MPATLADKGVTRFEDEVMHQLGDGPEADIGKPCRQADKGGNDHHQRIFAGQEFFGPDLHCLAGMGQPRSLAWARK